MKDRADAILHAAQASYLASLDRPRDALLAKIEADAAARGLPISDPEVGSLLSLLCALRAPKRVVELGTCLGYGAIVLARAAGPGARIDTVERSAGLVEDARAYAAEAALTSQIVIHEDSALGYLARQTEPIDLLYIDCVKEEYPAYIDAALPNLPSGALVVADNCLWKGLVAVTDVPKAEEARVRALRVFNTRLTLGEEFRGLLLPLGDGVTVATRV